MWAKGIKEEGRTGIFGEDEQDAPPRGARGRKRPSGRRNVVVSLDDISYRIDVEYVQNETDDDGGEVTVEFQLTTTAEDSDIASHRPELSGNVSYKAPTSGRRAADLADKISDAYVAVGHALTQWAKDAAERSWRPCRVGALGREQYLPGHARRQYG